MERDPDAVLKCTEIVYKIKPECNTRSSVMVDQPVTESIIHSKYCLNH